MFVVRFRQRRSRIPKNKSSPLTVPKKKIFLDGLAVCGSKSIGENGARKKKTAFDRPVATERTPPRPRRTASRRDISNRKTAGGGGPRGSRRRCGSGRRRATPPDDRRRPRTAGRRARRLPPGAARFACHRRGRFSTSRRSRMLPCGMRSLPLDRLFPVVQRQRRIVRTGLQRRRRRVLGAAASSDVQR